MSPPPPAVAAVFLPSSQAAVALFLVGMAALLAADLSAECSVSTFAAVIAGDFAAVADVAVAAEAVDFVVIAAEISGAAAGKVRCCPPLQPVVPEAGPL